MKLSIALVLASLSLASVAQASKKPTVCLSFTEMTASVDGRDQKVVMCQDGKKPVILVSYSFATIKDEDGNTVKAAIGWK